VYRWLHEVTGIFSCDEPIQWSVGQSRRALDVPRKLSTTSTDEFPAMKLSSISLTDGTVCSYCAGASTTPTDMEWRSASSTSKTITVISMGLSSHPIGVEYFPPEKFYSP